MLFRLSDDCAISLIAVLVVGHLQQVYCTLSALVFEITDDENPKARVLVGGIVGNSRKPIDNQVAAEKRHQNHEEAAKYFQ